MSRRTKQFSHLPQVFFFILVKDSRKSNEFQGNWGEKKIAHGAHPSRISAHGCRFAHFFAKKSGFGSQV
jgi:hypothetical protein